MNDLRVNKYIIDESKQWLDETRRNNTISYKGSSVLDSGLTTPLHHGSPCLHQHRFVLCHTWWLRLTQRRCLRLTQRECSTAVYRLTTTLFIMLIAQYDTVLDVMYLCCSLVVKCVVNWCADVAAVIVLIVKSACSILWEGKDYYSPHLSSSMSAVITQPTSSLSQFTSISISRKHSSDIILVMNTSS